MIRIKKDGTRIYTDGSGILELPFGVFLNKPGEPVEMVAAFSTDAFAKWCVAAFGRMEEE